MTADYNQLGQNLPKALDTDEAKAKIAKYCAYQERAHGEVKAKLYSYGISSNDVDEILAWLITENFVNEERYANTYTSGKFRIKKWGRVKIRQNLLFKDVSEYSINRALATIDETEYLSTIDKLIDIKSDSTKAKNIFELRHKISRSIIAKGFESELVWERLKEKVV